MIRVAIDAQPLQNPQKTGHAYYVEALLDELKILSDLTVMPCLPAQTHDLRTFERLLWDQFLLPRDAKRQRADILCTTAFSVPFTIITGKMKRVAIVHDLSLLRFPQNMRGISGWFLRTFVPHSFSRADRIIAISEATKKDLVELLHIPQQKISVVHSGVDTFFKPLSEGEIKKDLQRFNLKKPYLLFVGTLEPRKNLPFLISALGALLNESDMQLILVGKRGWQYEEIFSTIKENGLQDYVLELGYVSQEEKRALYNAAEMFVYPSMYEGFGMPVLEAMACGCPVISADTSSLPEVVGDAGLLLPLDSTDWAVTVKETLNNASVLKNMREKGLSHASKFTWAKTAQSIARIFDEVMVK